MQSGCKVKFQSLKGFPTSSRGKIPMKIMRGEIDIFGNFQANLRPQSGSSVSGFAQLLWRSHAFFVGAISVHPSVLAKKTSESACLTK